jgi:hypothetical protein
MTWGKKTGGKNFEKGHPGYKPKLSPGLKALKKLTTDKIIEDISRTVDMVPEELKQVMTDPESTGMQLALAKIMIEAIRTGDHTKMEWFMSRTVGKVTEKIEHRMPEPTIIELANGESIHMGAEMPEKDEEE